MSKKSGGAREDRPNIRNDKQYEALVRRGESKQKAARIANTPNSGKKGGHSASYEDRSKEELYAQAQKVGIPGRSKMRKEQLIHALRNS